jgi:hypothetical protein
VVTSQKKYLGENVHRHIKSEEFYSDFKSVELVAESHIKKLFTIREGKILSITFFAERLCNFFNLKLGSNFCVFLALLSAFLKQTFLFYLIPANRNILGSKLLKKEKLLYKCVLNCVASIFWPGILHFLTQKFKITTP